MSATRMKTREPVLADEEIAGMVRAALAGIDVDGKRVVVLIPDGTRTAPLPLMFKVICAELGGRAASLDFLIALGTHQPMSPGQITALVGADAEQRHACFNGVRVLNHDWADPATFVEVGTVGAAEVRAISGGRLDHDVVVRVNRAVVDCDQVIICGPVFPHEVVGYSGGNKYFFPGVGGPEIIDLSHWLGALITNREIIGAPGTTPVRRLFDRAAGMIATPKLCLAMVVAAAGDDLVGLYAGSPEEAWAQAAAHSARVHVDYLDRPVAQAISLMPAKYDDMWTAAKGMYKVEPVVADGGEVIVYAPHITEFSRTHGAELAEIGGYHVRDFFVEQWERYERCHWAVLAHSTHLKGAGSYDAAAGMEFPRIRVTLATGISAEQCAAHNLGYRDPDTVPVDELKAASDPDLLVVPNAGETLFRLRSDG